MTTKDDVLALVRFLQKEFVATSEPFVMLELLKEPSRLPLKELRLKPYHG